MGSSPVPVVFENTDLHSYVVMNQGRSYTAISTIPESVGYSLLPLAPVGGIIGWMFAVEQDGFRHGFSITGIDITRSSPWPGGRGGGKGDRDWGMSGKGTPRLMTTH